MPTTAKWWANVDIANISLRVAYGVFNQFGLCEANSGCVKFSLPQESGPSFVSVLISEAFIAHGKIAAEKVVSRTPAPIIFDHLEQLLALIATNSGQLQHHC